MKRIAILLFIVFFMCGCVTFGTFPNLKKGESLQEEVRSMLGEPAKKRFEEDKEVWQYEFVKKKKEKPGSMQTILNLDITFKEKEVDNYNITVSQESVKEGRRNVIQEGKPLPRPRGKGQQSIVPRERRGGGFISQFDRNGDGWVSRDEFDGPDKLFKRFDKNGDGYIDDDEAPKGPPPQRKKGKF